MKFVQECRSNLCICRRPESNRQCRQTYVESNHSSNYLTMPFSYFCICKQGTLKERLFSRQLRLPITPFAQCRQSRNRTYNSLLESLLYVPLFDEQARQVCICGRSRLARIFHIAQASLEFLDDLTVGLAGAGIHQINTILVSHFTNFFGHHSYLLLLVFIW